MKMLQIKAFNYHIGTNTTQETRSKLQIHVCTVTHLEIRTNDFSSFFVYRLSQKSRHVNDILVIYSVQNGKEFISHELFGSHLQMKYK